MPDDRKLRDALNLIGDYCRGNLPDGWMITLEVSNEEMCCELTDPTGDVAEGWESGECDAITDCCSHAIDAEDNGQ